MRPLTLADFPLVEVRLACRKCDRQGRYRLARLAERYGATMPLLELLEALAAGCERRARHHLPGIDRCGAYYADLAADRPPVRPPLP